MESEIAGACIGFWNCVSPDAWLTSVGTLIGAFLGAFLAGRFTLISVQKQLRNNDLQKRKQEISSHLKVSADILAITKSSKRLCNELLEDIKSDITYDEHFQSTTLKRAMICANDLDKACEQLKMIDYHLVPYESYNGYSAARETVFILSSSVRRVSDALVARINTDQMHSLKHFEVFEKYLPQLNFILEVLEKTNSDEEKEYDEIKLKLNKK